MKLVHIGLTKTGSTSLRRYIFPKIAEKFKINYLDIPDLPEKLSKSENFAFAKLARAARRKILQC